MFIPKIPIPNAKVRARLRRMSPSIGFYQTGSCLISAQAIFLTARIREILFLDILLDCRTVDDIDNNLHPYNPMEKRASKEEYCKEIEQLNRAVCTLLNPNKKDSPECMSALQNLFDLLLWADKKNSNVLQSIFSSDFLTLLLDDYQEKPQNLLCGMTMLLGNAKEDGLLVAHILEKRLGDRVLRLYIEMIRQEEHIQEDQHLHLLGSLLKAYHRHFKEQTYHLFISDNQCLLIDICIRFFNCPEEITRTSVMNILMSILKMPFIDKVLAIKGIGMRVSCWCRDMCRLFRNQLKDFDQHLLITDQAESQFIIHSITDKIILWQDLSSLTPHLFAPHFHSEIVLPLIVGSLNTTGIPLFTLKFALFVINKLIPTIAKLNLLTDLGALIFDEKDVEYQDQQLGTAILRPFSLKKLNEDEPVAQQQEQDEPNVFRHLNLFFMNILKSKDGRFLECACVLLVNLISAVKKSPTACQVFVERLGFGLGGATVTQISHIILTHFSAIHTLQITRIISALLIYVQPSKYFDDQLKNRLIHIYRMQVDEALQTIDKNKQLHPYLAEVLEYDIKALASPTFSLEPTTKTDSALLFNNQIIQNDTMPFYNQIPETDANIARYLIVKALLLRKLNQKLVEQCMDQPSIESYYQKIRTFETNHIKPGQYLRLPINVNSYRCKMEDGKISIPNCLLLQDDHNLIVGYLQNMSIRIITNFKYKHIRAEIDQRKKDKLYVGVHLKRYSSQQQNLEDTKGFTLKLMDVKQNYFQLKKNRVILEEINILVDILRRSKKIIPEVSLI